MDKSPLVSIPIITYNSSKTIIETLESVYAQTYQNIELIISDDCSKDNTIELCQKWIEQHKSRFVRTILLKANQNVGISANNNKAKAACLGKWIKGLSGDDLLFPYSIQEYINYVLQHPNVVYVFAKEQLLGEDSRKEYVNRRCNYDFFTWSIDQQYDFLTLYWNCLPNTTSFYNRQKILDLGILDDERIPMLDDHPRWITCIKKGVTMHFIDKPLVIYKLSETSISTKQKYSKRFIQSLKKCYWMYQYENKKAKWGWRYSMYDYCCYCVEKTNRVYYKILRKVCKILGFKKAKKK